MSSPAFVRFPTPLPPSPSSEGTRTPEVKRKATISKLPRSASQTLLSLGKIHHEGQFKTLSEKKDRVKKEEIPKHEESPLSEKRIIPRRRGSMIEVFRAGSPLKHEATSSSSSENETYVRETKKARTFLQTLSGEKRAVEKIRTYQFVEKAEFLAQGATALVYKVRSEEDRRKYIVLKLAQGENGTAEELKRNQFVLSQLHGRRKKIRGIQRKPYTERTLSKEAISKLLEKKPASVKVKQLQDLAILEKKYTGDLANLADILTFEQRIKVASDLFAGMEKMFEEKEELIHLDIKPENVFVNLKKGEVKEAGLGDFGTAFYAEEIYKNPQLLNKLTWTNSYVLGSDIDYMNEAAKPIQYDAKDPKLIKANKLAIRRAIAFAQKSMEFSFGVLLFKLFTAQSEDKTRTVPQCVFIVDRKFVNKVTRQTSIRTVEAETSTGFLRTSSARDDVSIPRFNREAFPEVPQALINLIEGLVASDPLQRKTFKEAYEEFKAIERNVPK